MTYGGYGMGMPIPAADFKKTLYERASAAAMRSAGAITPEKRSS